MIHDNLHERIPHFRNLIISHDKSLPEGKQWTAKLMLWDHQRKIGTTYISWKRITGTQFLIEGHETPSEAIAVVLEKYERQSEDKEIEVAS